MIEKKHIVWLLLVVVSPIFGSNSIKGVLLDSLESKPITYANIYFNHCLVGTSTSKDGVFNLQYETDCKLDTVSFSAIGYKTRHLTVSQLSAENFNTIYLQQNTIILDEVAVYADTSNIALNLMRKVIKAAEKNFSTIPYETKGFYEEFASIDGKCAGMMQSEMDFHHEGFNKKYSRDKYRYLTTEWIHFNNSRKSDYAISYNHRGGIRKSMVHDLLHFKFILLNRGLLLEKKLKYWQFELEGYDFYDDKEIVIIKFTANKKFLSKLLRDNQLTPLPTSGKIYINKSNHAIEKITTTNEGYTDLLKKEVHPSYLLKKQELLKENTLQFITLKNKYYVSYIDQKYVFRDFGWNGGEEYKIIAEYASLYLNNVDTTFLSDQKLMKKYGYFLISDDLRYQGKTVSFPDKYDPSRWNHEAFHHSRKDFQKCKIELNNNSSLEEQFEKNSSKRELVSNQDALQIRKNHRLKFKK